MRGFANRLSAPGLSHLFLLFLFKTEFSEFYCIEMCTSTYIFQHPRNLFCSSKYPYKCDVLFYWYKYFSFWPCMVQVLYGLKLYCISHCTVHEIKRLEFNSGMQRTRMCAYKMDWVTRLISKSLRKRDRSGFK